MADSSSETPVAVYGALAANVAIAATKFTVAAITGSAALLAEGVHSAVDSANELLLLVGLRRSGRAPDRSHPFGHGKELFFWGLIVAMVIFAGGGAISIFEGTVRLVTHHTISGEGLGWKLGVLGVAFVFESISLVIAIRRVDREPREPFLTALRGSRDPSIYTVVAEDSAALAGIIVAAAGVTLAHVLHAPWIDSAASIAIGAILCAVSIALAARSRSLLVGESVEPELVEQIQTAVRGVDGVVEVDPPLTMQLGPDEVLVNVAVVVDGAKRAHVLDEIKRAICGADHRVGRIFVEMRVG